MISKKHWSPRSDVSVHGVERITGAHRATVQRNIDWMEEKGLIREMTAYGRYQMWRGAN